MQYTIYIMHIILLPPPSGNGGAVLGGVVGDGFFTLTATKHSVKRRTNVPVNVKPKRKAICIYCIYTTVMKMNLSVITSEN